MSQSTTESTSVRRGTGQNVRQRVEQLVQYINQGRIIDAMYEFYAPDTQMQENRNPPSVGLEANVEREKQFLAGVKEWKGFTVKALAAEGDVSFLETGLGSFATDGSPVGLGQAPAGRGGAGQSVPARFYSHSRHG